MTDGQVQTLLLLVSVIVLLFVLRYCGDGQAGWPARHHQPSERDLIVHIYYCMFVLYPHTPEC
jgi:hypothetical protein